MDGLPSSALKAQFLDLLESDGSSFEHLAKVLRIDITRYATVGELVGNYEERFGVLSLAKWKYILKQLGYLEYFEQHVIAEQFIADVTDIEDLDDKSSLSTMRWPRNDCVGRYVSTPAGSLPDGLPFGNSVANALEGSSSTAALTGFQSSLVTGRDRLRLPKSSSKPSSSDWSPDMISGTMGEVDQQLRDENERLKVKVRQLEEELEREKALKLQSQSQVHHLQPELKAKDLELQNQKEVMRVVMEQWRESQRTAAEEQHARKMLEGKLQEVAEQMKTQEKRYDEKLQELENRLLENKRLEDTVMRLQQQLALERSCREQDREKFQQQLQQHIGEFQVQLRQCGEEFQRQLQQSRGDFQRQLEQGRGEFQRQLQQDRKECQRLLQQESENLQNQYSQQIVQERARFEQHLQHVERVAEERCARNQQPLTRTWIIQRNEVVLGDNVLGQGSWGIVREGTFRGSPVAVKELHSVIVSPHNRRLFEREVEISSQCRHPNILQLMGATSDDQLPLLVTELLDCNLRQLLEQRPLNRGQIVSLALDVARGLNYIHCNQPPIVHRDVKSDNVLVKKRSDNSWMAKVSDFGAANFRRLVMTPNQGTPLYSAPESSTGEYSELVDVYSFGLLLLEMCIRERPLPDQISSQIQQVPCPRLQQLIGRCVEQVSERRPKMNEMIQILTQLME